MLTHTCSSPNCSVTELPPWPTSSCLLGRVSSHLRLEPGGSILPRSNTSTQVGIRHPRASSQAMAVLFGDSSYPCATDELCSKTRCLILPSYTLQYLPRSWINSSLWEREVVCDNAARWSERFAEGSLKGSGKRLQGRGFSPSPLQHTRTADTEGKDKAENLKSIK